MHVTALILNSKAIEGCIFISCCGNGYVLKPGIVLSITMCNAGDSGHYDEDGHLIIDDRIKELIKVKGFQVRICAVWVDLTFTIYLKTVYQDFSRIDCKNASVDGHSAAAFEYDHQSVWQLHSLRRHNT